MDKDRKTMSYQDYIKVQGAHACVLREQAKYNNDNIKNNTKKLVRIRN